MAERGAGRRSQHVDVVAAQGNGGQKITLFRNSTGRGFHCCGYNAESTPPNTIMAKIILPPLIAARNDAPVSPATKVDRASKGQWAAHGKSVTFGVLRGLVEVGPPTLSMTLLIPPKLSSAMVIMWWKRTPGTVGLRWRGSVQRWDERKTE